MSEPKRDAKLTISYYDEEEDYWYMARPATDEDLAAMGYVKLEGIDMEALDRAYEHFAPKAMVVDGERTTRPAVLVGWAAEVIEHTLRQVLAALDGEVERG